MMSTEDITTESMRKLQIRPPPSFPSGKAARAGFTDLPTEVIDKILDHVEKCHPLILVCKQSYIPAGEKLYSKGPAITTEFPSRMRPVGFKPLDPFIPARATLSQLFCGMDIKEPSPDSPFGRDLKMRFMRHLPGIHHHFLSEREFDHLSDTVGLQRRISWNAKGVAHLLESLLAEGLEPFPALLDLRLTFRPSQLGGLHPYSHTPTHPFIDRRQSVVMSLAALCRPEWFESCLFTGRRGWAIPKFAGGHTPREVHHHVPDSPQDVDVKWPDYRRPFPSFHHGTDNVVHVRTHGKGVSGRLNDWSSRSYVERLLKVVKRAETGEDGRRNGSMSLAEQELRAKTRWCVRWHFDAVVRTQEYLDAEVKKARDWIKGYIGQNLPKELGERITVEFVPNLRL